MNMAAATAVEDNPLIYLPHHKFYSDDKLRRILSSVRTFAMVGASTNWKRPSFYAMKYLTQKGYRVIPGERLPSKTLSSCSSRSARPGPPSR